jgi:uroporphyrinogen decarboxylase
MNKIDRVQSVLAGEHPDRPPISFWHHFDKNFWSGQPAVDAHLQHVEKFDLDFVKIMNDNGYPRPQCGTLNAVADLDQITELSGTEDTFALQLDLIRALAACWKDQILMSTTIFNTWATLRSLASPPKDVQLPPKIKPAADPANEKIAQWLKTDRLAVAAALARIAKSLANFATACLDAGADGVFLSVRDDRVDTEANGRHTYDEMVRPTDLAILDATSAARFNMLHVCGTAVNFKAFADYPVHVINWADRYAGPPVADACKSEKPVICAGLDNLHTLIDGSPQNCADQVHDTLRQAAGRPIMIAPGCTYDPHAVPDANLHAAIDTVKNLTQKS